MANWSKHNMINKFITLSIDNRFLSVRYIVFNKLDCMPEGYQWPI